jgi:hypothetical protein
MFLQRVYLDYASTTPVDTEVFKKMKPFFTNHFHNAGGLYDNAIFVKKEIVADDGGNQRKGKHNTVQHKTHKERRKARAIKKRSH